MAEDLIIGDVCVHMTTGEWIIIVEKMDNVFYKAYRMLPPLQNKVYGIMEAFLHLSEDEKKEFKDWVNK